MDVNELEKLIGILKHSDISELEYQCEGATVRIKRGQRGEPGAAQPCSSMMAGGETSALAGGAEEPAGAPEEENLVKIESPIVGTFYSKPSPDAVPFVEVGAHVKKGERLCIVEAMKLMNEIESTVNGTVVKITLKEGEVVEYGDVLFLIKAD